MRFTDKSIAALRPKTARHEVWEGNGFGVRISPQGTKSWIWVYHHQGRPRRLTIGTYPAIGLADAHIKLAAAQKQLAQGIDPGDKEVERRKAERIAETVTELVHLYLEKHARPNKRSAGEDERMLEKDVLPAWGRRKAKDITRRDVIALLDKIVDRGSPVVANRTLATIRRMFNWALSRDILTANPCAAVKAPGKETRRDRMLSADEIKNFWDSLAKPKLPMSKETRLALKLQLATAQRRGEVINAEWSEFDLDEKIWTIPAEKAKNKMSHRVPLSPLTLSLLGEVKALQESKKESESGNADDATNENPLRWLFPSPQGNKPITGAAIDHAVRRALKKEQPEEKLEISDATPHDLRRTAASHMTSLGISRLVVSKILNHAEPGITAVYDRHSYDAEKRIALNTWGARLEEIITAEAKPSNVVDYAKKKRAK